ncbi:MAG: cell division ATP-binding protein FtsE [Firmicutes bacterium]|jgi:cell division transport system ATP-binding protein|nr:cell division ATP-binding protein FtsE [Bacillota bacterium]
MIEAYNLTKKYNGKTALSQVNLTINRGEFVFIVGPSGAGKSTLLKLIIREIQPTAGILKVFGRNISRLRRSQVSMLRRNVGMVFQDFRLLEGKTVFENVAFAMRVTGVSGREINKRVPLALDLVGLEHKRKSLVTDLSGGEQQRVGLARAIVNKPSMILADEPTGNLDPDNSAELMNLLRSINSYGTTIIVATHDRDAVDRLQKRVVYLDKSIVIGDEARGAYLRAP